MTTRHRPGPRDRDRTETGHHPGTEPAGISHPPGAEPAGIGLPPGAEPAGISPPPGTGAAGISPPPDAGAAGISPPPDAGAAGDGHGLRRLLAALAAGLEPGPFALLHRQGNDHLEVLTGRVRTVDSLAEVPLPAGTAGPATLAVVPYRQLTELGYDCVDDHAPLVCLCVDGVDRLDLPAAVRLLPAGPVRLDGAGFDLDDEEYGRIVEAVLRDEIGAGEGANFVIHRAFTATVTGDGAPGAAPGLAAGLAVLRRLLCEERGAYWTFLVYTGAQIFVGATPERHVSVADGQIMMNPISGTYRHRGPGPADRAGLLRFLADPKEINELYMVLDEELKMMAAVADLGGRVVGPYLKEMSRLTHTEYLLVGEGSQDVRQVLRQTMFAPTVTGSPIENACRVIARHERRGRGYYGGVLALFGHDGAGRQTLDAPILIRTAQLDPAGRLRVPVGATLVRDSTAAGEVAETRAKAAGVLAALGVRPDGGRPDAAAPLAPAGSARADAHEFHGGLSRPDAGGPGEDTHHSGASGGAGATGQQEAGTTGRQEAGTEGPVPLADDPAVRAALAGRNTHLGRFWLHHRRPLAPGQGAFAGRRALILDAEDSFTAMLTHQLRSLGLAVTRQPCRPGGGAPGRPAPGGDPAVPGQLPEGFDLVVAGPGPGDPDDRHDARIGALRRHLADLLERGVPTLAVCLGQQLLARLLGLPLARRDAPYQGVQQTIRLFGQVHRVGFYSSFTAHAEVDRLSTRYGPVELSRDPAEGTVHALRGPFFAGVQFHPESVLTEHGPAILAGLISPLLGVGAPATR